jgi:hypothetical protein
VAGTGYLMDTHATSAHSSVVRQATAAACECYGPRWANSRPVLTTYTRLIAQGLSWPRAPDQVEVTVEPASGSQTPSGP